MKSLALLLLVASQTCFSKASSNGWGASLDFGRLPKPFCCLFGRCQLAASLAAGKVLTAYSRSVWRLGSQGESSGWENYAFGTIHLVKTVVR